MGARFAFLIGSFAVAFLGLLFRLYDVQLVDGEYYQAQAASRGAALEVREAERGTIYFTDKDGNRFAAALNKEFPYVYAVPKDIEDPEAAAAAVAPFVGVSEEELLPKLRATDDPYVPLRYKLKEEEADAVRNLKIKGIYVDTTFERSYPFGTLAAHLLGFVGPRDDGPGKVGHYGVEKFYEEELRGRDGEVYEDGTVTPPVPGGDLFLTIDPDVQREAERALTKLIPLRGAKGGGVIVQEPKSGKILALAGYPTFDPNAYSDFPLEVFQNPMVEKRYEPGSVFKVLTMAAGIDAGAITPETTFVDTGSVTLNTKTIRNWDQKAYGKVTMAEVLERSINTGAVFVQRTMGREVFREYMERFGFLRSTEADLFGEISSDISRLNPEERDVAFATASYGHGVAVTPLALTNAVSSLANGGNLMRPYVNELRGPSVLGNTVRRQTAVQVADMMISAVDKATVAKIEGYSLAGKTGTAFVPDFVRGGYTENVINTYVGFGPVSRPHFTILIKLDEPEGAPVAALTVVPAFRELAQFLLNYYDIPPDRLEIEN